MSRVEQTVAAEYANECKTACHVAALTWNSHFLYSIRRVVYYDRNSQRNLSPQSKCNSTLLCDSSQPTVAGSSGSHVHTEWVTEVSAWTLSHRQTLVRVSVRTHDLHITTGHLAKWRASESEIPERCYAFSHIGSDGAFSSVLAENASLLVLSSYTLCHCEVAHIFIQRSVITIAIAIAI